MMRVFNTDLMNTYSIESGKHSGMFIKKTIELTMGFALKFISISLQVLTKSISHYICCKIYLIKMQREGESINPELQAAESQNQFINLTNNLQQQERQIQDQVYQGPFQQYFTTKTKYTQKITKINSKYNKIIENKIQSQLLNGKTSLSKKTKLSLQPKIQKSKQELINQERLLMQKRKDKVIQEYKEVLKEEAKLIRKNATLKKNHSNSRIAYSSEINQNQTDNYEWKQQILEAIKKNREFKSKLIKKSELVRQQFQEFNLTAIKNEQQKIEYIRQQNQKQAIKRHKRSESLKNIFIKKQQQCASLVNRVKPPRYQFQIMENDGAPLIRQLQEERSLKLQQLSLIKNKNTWEEIKQHQQSYVWRLQQRREQWMNNYQENTNLIKSRSKKFYHSIFVDKIRTDQIKQKVQQQEAEERGHRQLQKVKKYNSYILDHFKPKVDRTFQEQMLKQPILRHSLSFLERRAKGLEYLSLAKKTAKTHDPSNLQQNTKVASLPLLKPIYKDYLKQQPKRSTNTSHFCQFQNMLTQKRGDWTHQAFTLISKMQSVQTLPKGDKPLIQSVNNKLKLLKAMM